MADPVTNLQIEDVLSSIRKLVSEEVRAQTKARRAEAETDDAGAEAPEPERTAPERLVLSPSFRVQPDPEPEQEPATAEPAEGIAADAEELAADLGMDDLAEDELSSVDLAGDAEAPVADMPMAETGSDSAAEIAESAEESDFDMSAFQRQHLVRDEAAPAAPPTPEAGPVVDVTPDAEAEALLAGLGDDVAPAAELTETDSLDPTPEAAEHETAEDDDAMLLARAARLAAETDAEGLSDSGGIDEALLAAELEEAGMEGEVYDDVLDADDAPGAEVTDEIEDDDDDAPEAVRGAIRRTAGRLDVSELADEILAALELETEDDEAAELDIAEDEDDGAFLEIDDDILDAFEIEDDQGEDPATGELTEEDSDSLVADPVDVYDDEGQNAEELAAMPYLKVVPALDPAEPEDEAETLEGEAPEAGPVGTPEAKDAAAASVEETPAPSDLPYSPASLVARMAAASQSEQSTEQPSVRRLEPHGSRFARSLGAVPLFLRKRGVTSLNDRMAEIGQNGTATDDTTDAPLNEAEAQEAEALIAAAEALSDTDTGAAEAPEPLVAEHDDWLEGGELPEALVWEDHVDEAEVAEAAEPLAARVDDDDDDLVDVTPADAASHPVETYGAAEAAAAEASGPGLGNLDEEMLRQLVIDIVRQELQGALGERITRNVRKLVRREIQRELNGQDLL